MMLPALSVYVAPLASCTVTWADSGPSAAPAAPGRTLALMASTAGLPGIATLDDAHGLRKFFLADARVEPFHFLGTRGDDDMGDQRAGGDAAEAEDDDGHTVEFEKLFRRLMAHARAQPGGGKYDGNWTHRLKAVRLKRSTWRL